MNLRALLGSCLLLGSLFACTSPTKSFPPGMKATHIPSPEEGGKPLILPDKDRKSFNIELLFMDNVDFLQYGRSEVIIMEGVVNQKDTTWDNFDYRDSVGTVMLYEVTDTLGNRVFSNFDIVNNAELIKQSYESIAHNIFFTQNSFNAYIRYHDLRLPEGLHKVNIIIRFYKVWLGGNYIAKMQEIGNVLKTEEIKMPAVYEVEAKVSGFELDSALYRRDFLKGRKILPTPDLKFYYSIADDDISESPISYTSYRWKGEHSIGKARMTENEKFSLHFYDHQMFLFFKNSKRLHIMYIPLEELTACKEITLDDAHIHNLKMWACAKRIN